MTGLSLATTKLAQQPDLTPNLIGDACEKQNHSSHRVIPLRGRRRNDPIRLPLSTGASKIRLPETAKDPRRCLEGNPKLESQIMKMNMTNRLMGLALPSGLGLLTLAAVVATHSATADDSTTSAAIKAIQGTWVTSENDSLDAKWAFKGDSVEVSVNGTDYAGKIKADDKAKPHCTLDIAISAGPEESKGKTGKAIYKLDGEKLVISASTPGHDRPKDFEPVPDEVYVFELKKQKPK